MRPDRPDGNIVLRDGKTTPKSVGIIHCVGSRDKNFNNYCSVICCMQGLKFAHLVHERTGATVYNFYIDMRTAYKAYDEFYQRVLEEGTCSCAARWRRSRTRPAMTERRGQTHHPGGGYAGGQAAAHPGGYGDPLQRPAATLATPKKLARLFGISCSTDGWFTEKHPKLDPVATMTEGIFIVGCAQGPKDIPSSVAQGAAAAARVLDKILQKEIALEPIKASVDQEPCSGCRICNGMCPFNAITFHRGSHGDRDQSGAVPGMWHLRGGLSGRRDQRHGLQR